MLHGTKNIIKRNSEDSKLGWNEKIDFVLAFYVVHEIPNQMDFFKELESLLHLFGKVLVVEPPFYVSKSAFMETIRAAQEVGFKPEKEPKVIPSKTVILKKNI